MKVAAIQMNSSAQLENNLAEARRLISEAAAQGAELVVLPENFACMEMKEVDKLLIKEQYGSGPVQDFLSALARELAIWIVGGTIPLASEDDSRVYASSLLFDSQGQCVARYDKIHLFDVRIPSTSEYYRESDTILPGNEVVVSKTPLGAIGFSVCYDIRFPELYRSMLTHGVEIIVIPSAFTQRTGRAHWELLVRTRAVENSCYVIAANQSGVHQNARHTYGHSMIVDPWGETLAVLPRGTGCLYADLNPDHQAKIRENFPAVLHRKI